MTSTFQERFTDRVGEQWKSPGFQQLSDRLPTDRLNLEALSSRSGFWFLPLVASQPEQGRRGISGAIQRDPLLQWARIQTELDQLFSECHETSWDGHGAEAVTMDAYNAAARFARSFPTDIALPELSADTDGLVTFEWRKAPRRTLLVSVRLDGATDFAALIGTETFYGTLSFEGQFHEQLRYLIKSIFRP